MMWQFSVICVTLSAMHAPVTAKVVPTLMPKSVQIIGGHDIDIKEAPFQVSVILLHDFYCGGSIIAKDFILTAAHCITNRASPEDYKIRVGSSFSGKGGLLVPVANITRHPDFNVKTIDYDVALFKLETPLEFSDTVKHIDMIKDGEEIEDGAMVNVTGWGLTSLNGTWPRNLQQVSVQKTNDEVCRSDYSKLPMQLITPRMLCAGMPEGGKDACSGDSGGPLVYNGKLAGVVSWGWGCADPDFPGVYSKVSALRNWIDDNMKHMSSQHDSVN